MSTHPFGALRGVLTCCLLTTAIAFPTTSAHAAARIIGGAKVDQTTFDSSWRSMVSLQWKPERRVAEAHFCGGTLIAERIVLTARHCVERGLYRDDATDIAVYGGSPSLNGGGTRVDVVGIHVHRERSFFATGGDIAILELASAVPGSSTTEIARPEHAAWWGGGDGRTTGLRIAGWGIARDADVRREREFGTSSTELLSTDVPVIATDACAALVPWDRSVRRHICAGNAEVPATAAREARTSCYGDSGGPLLADDPAGMEPPRIVGIVSRGTHDECGGGPGIYTLVAARAAWVDDTLASLAVVPTLRSEEPRATVSHPAGNVVKREAMIAGALSGDVYRVDVQPPRSHGRATTGRGVEGTPAWKRTGSRFTFQTPPNRYGRAQVRIIRIPANGVERIIFQDMLPTKSDRGAPSTVSSFIARRVKHVHRLAWRPATDREDRVLGYVIEQRRVGARAWKPEAYLECGTCYLGGRAPQKSEHILLPGRREFRIAAVDRAGNRGPWTVSR